ncbi:hypothetical protein ACWELJ_03105 [Nocardia sp. NPDC004582]
MPEPSNTDSDPTTEQTWAEPDSLLGLIQRGRGAARAAAAAAPEAAAEHLIDCIVHDPRWDHQVEERDWLYATLAAELDIDLRRLRAACDGPPDPTGDPDAWLVVGVLERLARRGVAGSVTELRAYLRTRRDIDLAVRALIPFVDVPEADGLFDELLDVADDEQRRLLLHRPERRSESPAPMRPRASGLAARDAADRNRILQLAADHGLIAPTTRPECPDSDWETIVFEIAAYALADQSIPLGIRIATRRQVLRLRSPSALAWARTTAGLESEHNRLALSLLADLAEPTDADVLLAHLVASTAEGSQFISQHCDLVQALRRLDHRPAVPVVEAIADTTVYSYLRQRCALLFARLSEQFPRGRAIEYLDDCESETRGIAIATVDLSVPGVRERLTRIAADPTEEDDNRTAAAARIA